MAENTAKYEVEQAVGNIDIMAMAKDEKFGVAKMEELLDFMERAEARQAKKDYLAAMTEFKMEPPDIKKDAKVSFGKTNYNHATLGSAAEKISLSLAFHDITMRWETKQAEGMITVECILTHKNGHSESTSLSSPHDNSGGKNSIQALGSAASYLERYTMFAITGMAASDQDDDGVAAGLAPITKDQAAKITSLLEETGSDIKRFTHFYGCNEVADLQQSKYVEAMTALNAKMPKVTQ